MVAVTDYYPNKDGYINDGHVVSMCYAEDTTMTAGCWVALGTGRADYVSVKSSAAKGDAIGMLLRTPSAVGAMVPVCFRGVVKTIAYENLTIGDLVSSSITTVNTVTPALADNTSVNQIHCAGTAHILGTALQTAVTAADEVLVLVGKI